MSSHTPGPWVAELGSDGAFAIEADRQGITGGMLVLASRNTHPLMAEQMHANARLIAAAPTLLEALQTLMKVHDEPAGFAGKYGRKLDELVEAQRVKVEHATALARAAIIQATGGQA